MFSWGFEFESVIKGSFSGLILIDPKKLHLVDMNALLCGSTGLVGSAVLDIVSADERYENIWVLHRPGSPPSLVAPSAKVRLVSVNFDELPTDFPPPASADHIYCCLGTTIAQAGSQQAFERVDRHYVAQLAALYARDSASLAVISAVGVSATSRVFYNRVKGLMENDVQVLPYRAICFIKPSLLLGKRKKFRLGERVGGIFMRATSPFLRGSLSRYRPIDAPDVAHAMVGALNAGVPGVQFLEYADLMRLARLNRRS